MIDPFDFIKELESEGYDYFTGVPCSYLKELIHALDYLGKWIPAVNEGTAVGMAFGAYLAGKKPIVLLSLSGLPNTLNPILSLLMPYDGHVLFVVGMRGDFLDAPQHKYLMNFYNRIAPLINHRYIHFRGISKDYFKTIFKHYIPLGRQQFPRRSEVIKVIMSQIKDDEIVITNLGLTSRQVSSEHHRRGNFYMVGSMGHAMSIAKGLAPFTDKRIIVIDGDGSILMNLAVGMLIPKNILYILLQNNTYDSTGGQRIPVLDIKFNSRHGRTLTIRCREDVGIPPRVEEELPHITDRIRRFINE